MEPNQNTKMQNATSVPTSTGVSNVSSTSLNMPDKSVESSKPGSDVVFQDNLKKNMGMILTIVLLVLLAVGGIGFGVWAMMDGNSRAQKKDEQISQLQSQLAEKSGAKVEDDSVVEDGTNSPDNDSVLVGDLHLINSISPERRYYLGVTDLDQAKDSREMDMYLIDTTKLGTEKGVVKYDIKTVLDKIIDEKVASLPDILAEGTTNARPKSSCKSFKVRIGDVNSNPKNINWVYGRDWNDLLPFTAYTECMVDDGETISQSLGTSMYVLNPQTGEYSLLIDEWQ